jgi:hypothetical protein
MSRPFGPGERVWGARVTQALNGLRPFCGLG